ALVGACARAPVRPTPPPHRTTRRCRGPRHRRVALGLRAGPVVPPGEPRDDPRARAERVARRGPERAGLLWGVGGAQRPAGDRAPAPRRGSAPPWVGPRRGSRTH